MEEFYSSELTFTQKSVTKKENYVQQETGTCLETFWETTSPTISFGYNKSVPNVFTESLAGFFSLLCFKQPYIFHALIG